MPKTLEIACDSIRSAVEAERGGAHRIELCDNLAQGGITPSAAKIQLAKKYLSIPVFVLIRPRKGDFLYSDLEMETMLANIQIAKDLGADGIVSGCLNADGTLAQQQLAQLLAAATPLSFTFHRAFDMCRAADVVLEQLIQFGVDRVLTAGQATSAIVGKEQIAQWVAQAAGRIQIMAGAGIRAHNIQQLLDIPGLTAFHSSAKRKQRSQMQYKGQAAMGRENVEQEFEWTMVSEEEVRRMVEEIK
ncbi:MAG: copper homeostasis protein CutC [Bacteroidota bacterium]